MVRCRASATVELYTRGLGRSSRAGGLGRGRAQLHDLARAGRPWWVAQGRGRPTAPASKAVGVSEPSRAGRGGWPSPTSRETEETTRTFSGITPTGHPALGSYLGADRQWAEVDRRWAEPSFRVVDPYALTMDHAPGRLPRLNWQAATPLLAVALDPAVCAVLVPSHIAQHPKPTYVMKCATANGQMRRVIQ